MALAQNLGLLGLVLTGLFLALVQIGSLKPYRRPLFGGVIALYASICTTFWIQLMPPGLGTPPGHGALPGQARPDVERGDHRPGGVSVSVGSVAGDKPDPVRNAGNDGEGNKPDPVTNDSNGAEDDKVQVAAAGDGSASDTGSAAPPDPAIAPAGTHFEDCKACPEMVVLPQGGYRIGSPEHEPGHDETETPRPYIEFPKRFAVARFEVLVKEYGAFLKATGRKSVPGCHGPQGMAAEAHALAPGFKQSPVHPVVCVNTDDVAAYLAWLNDNTGKVYRLLTETEWEYAARAGRVDPHGLNGAATIRTMNIAGTGGLGKTSRSASYKANDFGLFDMHGNVSEWTQDCWNYRNPKEDVGHKARTGEGDCMARSTRGGSWADDELAARSAARTRQPANLRASRIGFRVMRMLP